MTSPLKEFFATLFFLTLANSSGMSASFGPSHGLGMGPFQLYVTWGLSVTLALIIFPFSQLNPVFVILDILNFKVSLLDGFILIAVQLSAGFVSGVIQFCYFYHQYQLEFPGDIHLEAGTGRTDKISTDSTVCKDESCQVNFEYKKFQEKKLQTFCTVSKIPDSRVTFCQELFATIILIVGSIRISDHYPRNNEVFLGALVALLLICLAGPTGLSMNPARDLGPRIAHYCLLIRDKGNSNLFFGFVIASANVLGAFVSFLILIYIQ